MKKKVAVIAFNPVNGFGLFQYLESFYENEIPFKTFAIADSKEIKTNSGVPLTLDDTIANLKGHESEYDALVFACGDAMMTFAENESKQYYVDMFDIIKKFGNDDKIIVGHCAAAIMFDKSGISDGKKIAVHPLGKAAIQNAEATDDKVVIDGNLYTAQREDYIWMFMKKLTKALKD